MQDGFIKLGRSFFEHYLWQESREFSKAEAWLDCVQLATFRPYKTLVNGELIEVPRGGFVASERYLSDRWKWSRTKLRAFLDLLTKDGMISRKKTTVNTIVSLCNFEKYNLEKDQQKTREEPPRDHAGTKEEEGKEGECTHRAGEPYLEPKTPSLETVIAAGANFGVSAAVCERFWNLCESRPLSPDGRYTDRDGRGIRNWQFSLKNYADSHSEIAARNKSTNSSGRPSPPREPKYPPPAGSSPDDFDEQGALKPARLRIR